MARRCGDTAEVCGGVLRQRPLKEQMDGYKELIQERENILCKKRTVLGTNSEDSPKERRAAE